MWSVILAITLAFLVLFFMSRLLLAMYLTQLIKNRKNREKRKEGQSFWDWLTYKRFKDIIPKTELSYWLYFANAILYLVLLISTILLDCFNMLEPFRTIICEIQFIGIGGGLGIRYISLGGLRKR